MRYIILSDSHGRVSLMEEVLEKESAEAVIHLGDCTVDVDRLRLIFPHKTICGVKGNNDYFSDFPQSLILPFGSSRIFACHGHTHNVRRDESYLIASAKVNGCDIVLYGHTHNPVCKNTDGITVIKPGSGGYGGSYAVLENKNGEISAEIKSL